MHFADEKKCSADGGYHPFQIISNHLRGFQIAPRGKDITTNKNRFTPHLQLRRSFLFIEWNLPSRSWLRRSLLKVAYIFQKKDTSDVALFKSIFAYEEYKFDCLDSVRFIIDACANIGLSTAYFARRFPNALIAAIEAEKENYLMPNQNTRQFPNVKTLNAGVWPNNYEVQETGFMVTETSPNDPSGFRAISIADIIQQYQMPHVDLFKIEFEGAEKEVFENNTGWLEKTKSIILELHDRKKVGCSQAFLQAFSKYHLECHPLGQNFLLYNKNL